MKNIKYLLVVSFAVSLILPSFASAATVDELQTQIKALFTQIQQLQAQLAQTQGQPVVWCHDFNVNLKVGDQGNEIEALHTALEKEGFNVFAAGPEVSVSEVRYFSEKTASAVSGFQQKYKDEILTPLGLQYGTGYVGKATRAKLNSLYGCGVKPPVECAYPCPQYSPPAPCPTSGYKQVCEQVKPNVCGCYPPPSCKCVPIATTNQPPVISGVSGPTTLNIGQTGTWTVKASDPEQGVLTYQVFWGDEAMGASAQLSQPLTYYSQTTTFTHSYSKSGIYSPTFTVVDNQGLSAKTSISVNVGAVTTPFITVLSPNGGERWEIGKTYEIQYKINNPQTTNVQNWKVSTYITCYDWNKDYLGGRPFESHYLSDDKGLISWTIPSQPDIEGPANQCRAKVELTDITTGGMYSNVVVYRDLSDAPFSIVAAASTSAALNQMANVLESARQILEQMLESLKR